PGSPANRGSWSVFMSLLALALAVRCIPVRLALAFHSGSYMIHRVVATTERLQRPRGRNDREVATTERLQPPRSCHGRGVPPPRLTDRPATGPHAVTNQTLGSGMSTSPQPDPGRSISHDERRVQFATVVGTTVEWYDFFIYATATGLIFAHAFFEPAGEQFAQILSFVSVGISFLFRPLGAFIAGHLGDRFGRRLVLILTLILMGASTTLVGVLPTHATIGLAAPILLILLRVLQGVSAGGEWGGAVLLAVEHAPTRRRGMFGSSPQIGVPLGLLLASGLMGLMTTIAPGDAFTAWGWRIPFLLSFVLVLIGHYVRRQVEETPVFTELAERREKSQAPIKVLFKKHAVLVLV